MRLVKKLLNHTETYVILIALLFGVAVEAVSHQFFSNTGMVNLARISMIYLIFGVAEMLSLVWRRRTYPTRPSPACQPFWPPVSLEARITRAPF